MKNMKKFLIIISAAVVSLFTFSCSSDLLDLENPNSLTTSTAFTYEADIDASLTGVYHSFYSSYYAMMSSNQFSGQTDECLTYSVQDLINYIMFYYTNYSWLWNSTTWNQLYQQISRCNQVIVYADKIESWSAYDKSQIVAQAKAIRAYAYYQMTMLYQKEPYVDYVTTAGDKPAESSWDVLCQHIIDDALVAYQTLPSSYKSSQGYTGNYKDQYRVTKWFAACVLAKTYMNWDPGMNGNYQYDKALPYYKDIVENGPFTLVDDPMDCFNLEGENNSESIFEIQNAHANQSAMAYYGRTNDGSVPDRGMWRWKFYGASPVGWADYNAEAWLLYAFKNEKTVNGGWDERLEASLLYQDIFTDFPGHNQWGYTAWRTGTWNASRVYINKYVGQYETASEIGNEEGTNNRIFRLGEIKLDYAECLAMTGDLPGAIQQIDDVRGRAGLAKLSERVPVSSIYTNADNGSVIDFNADFSYAAIKSGNFTASDILNILDIEDAKESCFECERFVDIRRWGVGRGGDYTKRLQARSDKYLDQFKSYMVWLPIPLSEVDNNPNVNQNDGY